MSVVSVQAKSFILALFIRDDGERFLLGDNGYEFKDGQLHFSANDIENDEVAKQGADGVMLAGQVRRSSVQEFEGYVGDATDAKDTIEDKRKAFIAFFASGHHFRVVYVDCNSNAWQRKGGYLVDAPEVKELWQIHPEYHVGLNFEDVNYYSYNEDAEGDEILANYLNVPVSSDVSGGLEWDSDGAVSEDATVEYDTETKTATKSRVVSFSDGISAPIADIQLDGETSQKTYSGKNLFGIPDQTFTHNGVNITIKDGEITMNGTANSSSTKNLTPISPITFNGTYSTCLVYVSGSTSGPSASAGNVNVRRASNSSLVADTQTDIVGQNNYRSYSVSNESVIFGIYVQSGNVFNNLKFKVQIVAGSTADYNFEPYVGGIPAPNPSYPQAVRIVTGENVVKICGKNLFNKNTVVTGALMSNGTIDASYTDIITSDYIPVKAGETYILSGVPGGWGSVGMYDSNKTFISRPYNGNGQYAIPANATYARPVIAQGDLGTCQFELGSTATPYEPYKAQSYEVNLGKNLLDSSSYSDSYIDNSGGVITGGGLNALFGYIDVSPSTSYTISASSSTWFSAAFYIGTSFISRDANHDGTSLTFTTPNNCNRIRCWVYKYEGITQSYIDSLNLQLELGSQATSYAPYFTPIELCKIGDYQDYIYKSDGKWYVHKECVGASLSDYANTARRGTTNTSGKYRFRLTVPGVLPAATTGTTVPSYCSHIVPGAVGQTYTTQQRIAVDVGTNNYVFVFTTDTEAMSEDEFKAWLTGKNMSFYYPLATPTDTEITNQALIAQLDALAEANIYNGTNNIFTVTPNEQPSLEVVYYTKYIVNVTAGGYVWEEGGSGGPTTVINDSISNVAPVWTVYGPTVNPVLENTTTGEEIEYVGTIADGQTLVIDMGEQTALLNGLNVIGNVTGDYVSLAPGQNTLLYSTSSGDTDSEIGWSEIVG